MNYILNKSAVFSLTEKGLLISIPGIGFKVIVEGIDEYLEFVNIFNSPTSYEDAFEILNQKNYIDTKGFEEMILFSEKNNILKTSIGDIKEEEDFTDYHIEKYSRQIRSFLSLPEIDLETAVEMQKKIQKAKVVIIGLGGTGSYLALSLAAIGVENLVIVDKDSIELSNTSRQILYDESDLGKMKLDVAEKKLKKYNKNLKVHKYERCITELKDLEFLNKHENADLIVLCADTPRGEIEYIIDEIARNLSIPWFSYGPFHHSKVIIGPLFIPRKTKSYSELFSSNTIRKDPRTEEINKSFYSAIIDPFNGLASKMAAVEVLKFLTGYAPVAILGKRFIVDTDNWKIEEKKI